MSRLEALFVRVENDAFHAVVNRLAALEKARPDLRCLEIAEFSPPHPWLRLAVPLHDVSMTVPKTAERISEGLGCRVFGLVGDVEGGAFEAWLFDAGVVREHLVQDDVFRTYDLPRFSDHRLRIGPAWPFRRFDVFW